MSLSSKVYTRSSLHKIFPQDSLQASDCTRFSMLKNERKSFQLAIPAANGARISFTVSSALSNALRFYYVKMIPAGLNAPKKSDDYYIAKDKTEYPDFLEPIADNAFNATYDGWNTVWVEICAEAHLPIGTHTIAFSICIDDVALDADAVEVEVVDACLPKQTLIYTNWFHTDCLMQYYGFDAFSDEYWRVTENYLRRAREYGMNCVLTPLFTPPLDTKVGGERPTVQLVDVTVTGKNQYTFGFEKLDKWLAMCECCGIEYYEMSHLFTQWGAKHAPKIVAMQDGDEKKIFGWSTRAAGKKYARFLAQFAKALIAYIDQKGIRAQCLFHVSDEPNKAMLRGYKKASKIIHENFPGFKIIDALSEFSLYEKGLIQTPIPANDSIDRFIGHVPELWTYYCSAQGSKNVSNRFFSMYSLRNRVLGAQLYKFKAQGFLHWGFNFYFLQYSKGLINPYKVADAGGAFSSGDSFVVYPGKNGEPLNSLRLLVFYDALQDMQAIQLLESKIGREKTVAILEAGLETPLTFSEYPHTENWLLEMRERINQAIQNNL